MALVFVSCRTKLDRMARSHDQHAKNKDVIRNCTC